MRRLTPVLMLAVLLVPCVAHAQMTPNSWFLVLNANYNVATIKNYGSSINGLGAGVQFDRVLGGKGAISLGITASYLNVDGTLTADVQGLTGPEQVHYAAKTKGAPIAVYGRYLFGGPGIRGYIGVGPGLLIGETTVQVEEQPGQSQSTTKFAGMAMAGGMFKMGDKVYLNAGVTLFLVPDAEVFNNDTWAGNLGIVIPLGNP
jgi:hypothetical protein